MPNSDSLTSLSLPSSLVTIGSFDGVHLGHQAILQDMVRVSGMTGIPSVVVTFFPHPYLVLKNRTGPYYLTHPDERRELIVSQGVDHVITLSFDESLSSQTADAFLENLQAQLRFKAIWSGENFAFGKNREGTVAYLEGASQQLGFDFHLIPPCYVSGEMISSSRIRKAVIAGDVAGAAAHLGRRYDVRGEVIHGASRGRNLGFPTANLACWEDKLLPQNGVYACWAEVDAEMLPAVINIGHRPTFYPNTTEVHLEAHLLDSRGDLYGKTMRLEFVAQIRPEKKFASADDLLQQIQADVETARTMLKLLVPGQ